MMATLGRSTTTTSTASQPEIRRCSCHSSTRELSLSPALTSTRRLHSTPHRRCRRRWRRRRFCVVEPSSSSSSSVAESVTNDGRDPGRVCDRNEGRRRCDDHDDDDAAAAGGGGGCCNNRDSDLRDPVEGKSSWCETAAGSRRSTLAVTSADNPFQQRCKVTHLMTREEEEEEDEVVKKAECVRRAPAGSRKSKKSDLRQRRRNCDREADFVYDEGARSAGVAEREDPIQVLKHERPPLDFDNVVVVAAHSRMSSSGSATSAPSTEQQPHRQYHHHDHHHHRRDRLQYQSLDRNLKVECTKPDDAFPSASLRVSSMTAAFGGSQNDHPLIHRARTQRHLPKYRHPRHYPRDRDSDWRHSGASSSSSSLPSSSSSSSFSVSRAVSSATSCSSFLSRTSFVASSLVADFVSGLFFGSPSGLLLKSKVDLGRIFRNSNRTSTTHSSSSSSSSFTSPRRSSSSSARSSLFSSSSFDARLPFFLFSVVALIGLTLSGSQQLRKQHNRFSAPAVAAAAAVSSAGSSRRVGSRGIGGIGGANRDLIQVGFQTVLNETRNVPCPVVGGGEIPRWLSGYFLRHTPGTYGQENRRSSTMSNNNGDKRTQTYIDHLFDGLAMVSSYELRGGAVKFSNKYLETHGYKIWEHYGKDMAKSYVAWGTTFSKMNWTQAVRWRQNFTEPEYYRGNPNVNFWRIGGNIQAVDESAHGLMFDVDTLETKSMYVFEDSLLAPGYEFFEKIIHPAHEQIDLDGSVWNVMGVFTIKGSLFDQANWTVYRIEDNDRRVSVGSTPIGSKMFDLVRCFNAYHYPDYEDRAGYMHSFAMSRNYVVLPVVPYFLDYCTLFALRRKGHGAFFRTYMQVHAAQGLKFHVMRKSDGVFVKNFTMSAAENVFVTHQVNAFEDEGKKLLHVDMLTYKSPEVYQTAYIESILQEVFADQEATIERFSISLVDFSLVSRRPLSKPQPMEFPTINYDKYRQRDYQFTYLITRPYLTRSTIMKLNVKTGNVTHWGPEEGVFPSEAVFVPAPGSVAEDDGVLLSGLLDAKFRRGFILVLNATTMEEISRARAPINTPFGLHNRFFSHAEMSTSSAASEPTIASPSYWPSFSSGDIGKQVSAGEDDDDDQDDDDDDANDASIIEKGSSRKGPTQTHVPGVATAVIIFNISCLHVFSISVALFRHLVWP